MKSGKQKKDLLDIVRTKTHRQYNSTSRSTKKELPKSGLALFTLVGDSGSSSFSNGNGGSTGDGGTGV